MNDKSFCEIKINREIYSALSVPYILRRDKPILEVFVITKNKSKAINKLSAVDAIEEVKDDLIGISEIALALSTPNGGWQAFAIIANLAFCDSIKLQKVIEVLEKDSHWMLLYLKSTAPSKPSRA